MGLVSVLCAAAVGGGLATLMHQQKEAALQHRLALFDTKLTELTATVSMLTTMTTGTDTDTHTDTGTGSSSSNHRHLSAVFSDEAPTTNRNAISSQERLKAFLEKQSDGHVTSVDDEEEGLLEATPLSDNDLVCTSFRAWLSSGTYDEQVGFVATNRTIYKENAVGETEKKTMYKPTAKNIRLCNSDKIVCPTPTEELGIFAGNVVYDAAGPTLADNVSSWRNYMVLLDPFMIETGNGPLTQYQSSFAYTEYDYTSRDDSFPSERVPEFPITGGTGRFGSASGSVKNIGYSFITNEDTGYYEDFLEVQFNVCVPPPKNTNPAPPGPPKKSGKTNKASF